MKRIGLALGIVIAFTASLTLLPRAAWAWGGHGFHGGHPSGFHAGHGGAFVGHGHHAFHGGCCVFIGHGHPFVTRGFSDPHSGSAVIGVNPAHQPVWIPGFWWWNGVQWVWAPGHRAFPGQ